MKKYSLKTYLLKEGTYGDYPEDTLKPLNTFGVCLCGDECNCGAVCQCGDPDCAQCGKALSEAVLEEEDEELLTDLEEAAGCGAVAGAMMPLEEDDDIEEG